MKALVFGSRPDRDEPRPVPTDELEQHLVSLPFGLHELDDARPILAGICGSDSKLILGEFDDGDIDNPMAAFSSLPLVPGHEVVTEVVAEAALASPSDRAPVVTTGTQVPGVPAVVHWKSTP